ncbi:hypothetical protein COCNU_05G008600 [Cocos nucifera]|uniref:Tubulin--tyrosine ligase-like protein 12 SET-like domain-containing protein n=1 Tax=Cocos nucifera TaxID=13894 RepID=A0A8K0I9P2_COCNU|nr:hypothetical protein COCNU_05G008600 [Cocos nucifera]
MASPSVIRDFDVFEKVHAILLAASGIPPPLHRQLFRKLSSETFDGGDFFSIEPCEGGRKRRLVLSAKFLAKESDVFLIDHAWSFRLPDALKQLREVPSLAERMAALMCVDLDLKSDTEEPELENEGDGKNGNQGNVLKVLEEEMDRVKERGSDAPAWLELEEMGIDDAMLQSLDLSTKFPNLVALNLWGNKLQDVETVVREVTKCRKLKALWLNENPVLQSGRDAITKAIIDGIPGLEIYNSCFTIKSGEWALGFCGGIFGADNPDCSSNTNGSLEGIATLDLSDRSIHHLPKAFSPVSMPSLSHLNLQGNPLDQISAGDLFGILSAFACLQDLEVDIPGPLGNSALKILESFPNLSSLNGVGASRIIEDGKHVIYAALQPRLPEWKSTEPLADSVIGAMWLYLMTYRLADEEKIDETSVWYVMDELGSALQHSDEANFRVAPFLFMPEGQLESAVSLFLDGLMFRYQEHGGISRAYVTDISVGLCFLPSAATDPKDADIIWTSMQIDSEIRKALGLSDNQYINQFPFEACLVMKHHLAETIHKAQGSPQWLQPTYNLQIQLSQLIGDYYARKQDGRDNLWILKPWNMARTIDTTVTGDLSAIIRLMETGPKICQKYIERPALFKGKKFDIRYIILVCSMNPVEIFLADVFWVRLANNPYTLDKDSLFEYETHFTVMIRLRTLYSFPAKEFNWIHGNVKWLDIHQRIRNMIRSLFDSAAAVHPVMHSPFSRAMYGVDVMLDHQYMPKILEVTYCPDCTRACKYDTEAIVGSGGVIRGRDFFNFVFGCLFLDESTHVTKL